MQLTLEFTLVFLILVTLSAGVYFYIVTNRLSAQSNPLHALVTIREHTFDTEVADSFVRQAHGLSGKASLTDTAGMLFLFSSPAIRDFWMQGMVFPIDVIWIHDGVVVDITHSVQPPTVTGTVATMRPSVPATMVLEVNAGLAKQYGIAVGDIVSIQSIPARSEHD